MKTVLHYRLYMCKPFSNPAILTKNVNQKFQYLPQYHRKSLHDNLFLSTTVISSNASSV